MTEKIIQNVGSNLSDLPVGTKLRGPADTGDRGCTAVRTTGGWLFTDRDGDTAMIPRLYAPRYELVDGFEAGDVIPHTRVDELPLGSVLLYAGQTGDGAKHAHYILVCKVGTDEYRWINRSAVDGRRVPDTEHAIHVGYWKIVTVGDTPVVRTPPQVGDRVDSKCRAALLPVGSVMVELAEAGELDHAGQAPAFKVADDQWLYLDAFDEPDTAGDDIVEDQAHRVVYIPEQEAS